jgi:hypothetical protein
MQVLYKFSSTGDQKIDKELIEALQKYQKYLEEKLSNYKDNPGVIILYNAPEENRIDLTYDLTDFGDIEEEVRIALALVLQKDH